MSAKRIKKRTSNVSRYPNLDYALGGYLRYYANGGKLSPSLYLNQFNAFNTGGLHETNPLGGIPQGMGQNGQMNTVEQGEASYNFDDGKYIFSNRLY
jgi:hypothetical protein